MDEKEDSASRDTSSIDQEKKDIERLQALHRARPDCFGSTIVEILFVLTCTMSIGMQALLVGSVTVITNDIGTDLRMSQPEYVLHLPLPTFGSSLISLIF